jgi:hypothetical protein
MYTIIIAEPHRERPHGIGYISIRWNIISKSTLKKYVVRKQTGFNWSSLKVSDDGA